MEAPSPGSPYFYLPIIIYSKIIRTTLRFYFDHRKRATKTTNFEYCPPFLTAVILYRKTLLSNHTNYEKIITILTFMSYHLIIFMQR